MNCTLYPPLFIHEIGQRANQEDSLWPKEASASDRLFVLCDGMGGHEKGEVASQTVCQALGSWFAEHVNPDEPFTDVQLKEAIEHVYHALDQFGNASVKMMGTTLTLLYMHKQGVTTAHIGDSRIYHIRPEVGVLYQSRDHSLVFDLYQSGEITYEEMATYPQKNVITRAMTPGENNRHRPDVIHITDIQPGDYFYMCSDGMLEQMSNEELVELLSSPISDDEKRQRLIVATVNNQDNHTAWLLHVKDVVKEAGDEALVNEEPTARCNALNIKPRPSSSIENDEDENDVKVVDDDADDVVLLSSPKRSKKPLLIAIVIAALVTLLIAAGAIWLFSDDTDEVKIQRPKPMIETIPVKHQQKKQEKDNVQKQETITNDTNKALQHDTAGNQQPVNAPRGNYPSRRLPR